MRAARKLSTGDIYHVIQRGTGRQIIFEDNEDRKTFLSLLSTALSENKTELLCWCLMSNHVHLLIRGDIDAISATMKSCCGRYAQHFNKRHGRIGHLFQERYKSEPVNDETYLLTVVRYIHQNPEKACICKAADWPWSSYQEYVLLPAEYKICETDFVLACFGGMSAFVVAHNQPCENSECMEVFERRSHTSAMHDEVAIEVAEKLLGKGSIECVKSWKRDKRGEALVALHDAGLTIRQIERLTGVGRGIINYALKHRVR